MKPTIFLFTLGLCLYAQDDGRIVVQGHGGSKPRQVNIEAHNGPVTVKTYSGNDLAVEPCGSRTGTPRRSTPPPPGMHRLNLNREVDVQEQDNVFTVRGTGSVDCVNLSVPVQTSVKVVAHNGSVEIDGVHGDIEIDSHNGRAVLSNVSGTANVSTRNGTITASMDRVETGKPSSFSSVNGKIDITLPSALKANLKLKAFQGDIWTDFDVMMSGARPSTNTSSSSNGRYRVTFDRTINGTINGGGVDVTLNTLNGSIYIHKK